MAVLPRITICLMDTRMDKTEVLIIGQDPADYYVQ